MMAAPSDRHATIAVQMASSNVCISTRSSLIRIVGFFGILSLAVATSAQYGHPLKGSWSGDWGTGEDRRTRLLLVFDWDGTQIIGTLNPGPSAVPIATASLDPSSWTVQIEAEGQDDSGAPVPYVIIGELQNIGSSHRVITGSWTQGTVTGDFTITRN